MIMLISLSGFSQETFPVNGTREKDVVYTAFTNATIHVDHETVIENGTMVVYKGKIFAIGAEVVVPLNAVMHDLKGKHVYPSFVDLDSSYGMPKMESSKWDPKPQMVSKKAGAYGWNEAIKSEVRGADIFAHQPDNAKGLREMGFGAVLTHQHDGIARGTSVLVGLGSSEHKNILKAEAAAHYSFRKGSSSQNYPSSLMGCIALLRQTHLDGLWYDSKANIDEANLSLEAWNNTQTLPQIFEIRDKLSLLRADLIGDEFGVQYIFKTSCDSYQRLADVKATNGALILSLNYPEAYDVSDPYLTRMISLKEMKHWELAPTDAARVAAEGIPFAITSNGAGKDFMSNLRKAIKNGLSEADALQALTSTPAQLIGAEDQIGSLQIGYSANFIISAGNVFGEKNVIHENWVQGERFVLTSMDMPNLKGAYNFKVGDHTYEMEVKGKPGKHKASIEIIKANDEGVMDTTQVDVTLKQNGHLLTLTFNPSDGKIDGLARMAGNVNAESRIWDGQGQFPNGRWFDWVAVRQGEPTEDSPKGEGKKEAAPEVGAITYPLIAYGWKELPEAETVLIKNATVWTCETEGIIEKGQVLIHNGKIAALGKDLDLGSLFPKQELSPTVIDAKGKHVSPGIIDEHTHIAGTRGINEGTQASSAEVQIGSIINSDDVNMYRHLAGGVTAAQVLHGSANPIGGQSGLIKFRWGQSPEEMKIKGADGFIKFALGENVKQSNWGDYNRVRFPQTRMGVEQVYYDHFILAREYGEEWENYWDTYSKLSKRQKKRGEAPQRPRRDLELECLLQILNSERFVSCHSYRQDEINMLMHVADSMGFTLNTFTHILEGYKVADKMKEHGAGGSSFSDWWAYKYEVKDAIPYNGAIMWEQGIVTAFNSDDREMARRLNQEAAKAVKYGGVPEEEALKFVTLNPAKLLHLDERMGSLKVGKDADLVIWSDHPMSIYAKAEKTYVDGICYFDMERDEAMRKEIASERARIIQKMSGAAKGGEKTQKPKRHLDRDYHCDTIYGEDAR